MDYVEVDFQVALGAVKHFGRNLYTSNPPAIAELVANAWDAYATRCEISYNSQERSLLVFDNGIGMTDEEFKNRYAVSGMEKQYDIRIPDDMLERPYMGRKGIGKFSVFSLGTRYYIYTKSIHDDDWKKVELIYDELMTDKAIVPISVKRVANLDELDKKFPLCDLSCESGTLIFIPEMKRKFIETSSESLKSILARRFSVNISGKYGFSLKLNNEEIDLSKHFYDDRVEFLYYFGYTVEEMKDRFVSINNDDFFINIENTYLDSNNVKGWIGGVNKTSDLRIDDKLNSSGVIVYINGKLADEDILQTSQNSTVANLYIVGEVEADFLQNEEEDPVLSSREGLNKEIDNVNNLKKEVEIVRNAITKRWSEFRSKREEKSQPYLEEILTNGNYRKTYDELEEKEKIRFKKYSQNLFDGPKNNMELKDVYVPFLFSVINSQSISEITVNSTDDTTTVLQKFIQLFEKSEVNSALRLKQNFQDRLNVIEELEKNIEIRARESIFEKHLVNNPWLLNVFWDSRRNRILTQQKYNILLENGDVIKGRSDIIIEAGDEDYPIIVEIKREASTSYSTPSISDIKNQIEKYRKGIKQLLLDKDPEKYNKLSLYRIQAYMLVGSVARRKLDDDDIESLKKDEIKLLTYEGIIENAKNIYMKEKIIEY